MKILIIENHPITLLGLKAVIAEYDHAAEILLADSFHEGLALLRREPADLVIVDIEVEGGGNLNMMEQLREALTSIRILIYSSHDEQLYALPYLQAGADGFLSKEASKDEFEMALKVLASGRKYVSYNVQQLILNNIGKSNSRVSVNPIIKLSPREIRIMELVAEGKWTNEIAAILNLTDSAVSTCKRRIFSKLNVTNPVELSRKISLIKFG